MEIAEIGRLAELSLPGGRRIWRLLCGFFALLVLLFVGFYVNRYIRIEGLYMDDLYMWSCYGEQPYLQFAFPFRTSTRFRPVYWSLTYLEMMVVRNHPSLFVPVNILLNIGVAFTIYLFSRKLSGENEAVALICGCLYLASHFSYYQIGQALGLLETMSLWMALRILWLLYDFISGGSDRLFYQANLWYFLLAFSHERFIGLLPLFYVAVFFQHLVVKERKIGRTERARHAGRARRVNEGLMNRLVLPALNFALIFAIRKIMIGSAIPAGTGGTEVTETFSLPQAMGFACEQVAYLFSLNPGPEHLSGITWEDVAPNIRMLVCLSWIPLFLIVFSYFYLSLLPRRSEQGKKGEGNKSVNSGDTKRDSAAKGSVRARRAACAGNKWGESRFLGHNVLFLSFIALCIGCSSVTIRVEMRWIYVSYAAALLYLSYMISVTAHLSGEYFSRKMYIRAERGGSENGGQGGGRRIIPLSGRRERKAWGRRLSRRFAWILTIFFLAYAALVLPVEKYYRSHYGNIYFWENQQRMNSLAEETVLKYGIGEVLGRQVYILENKYGMSDFYGDTFFKVYDPEKTGQGTRIHFIQDVSELLPGSGPENTIILREVPEKKGYQDVTEEIFGIG